MRQAQLRAAGALRERSLGITGRQIFFFQVRRYLEYDKTTGPDQTKEFVDVSLRVRRLHMLQNNVAVDEIEAMIGEAAEVVDSILDVVDSCTVLVELPRQGQHIGRYVHSDHSV